jgi:nitrite reductase (NADH) small subunit
MVGTTRSVIRWVLVGRPDGVRAAIRREAGCMTWLDRGGAPSAGSRTDEPFREREVAVLRREGALLALIPLAEVPPGTVVEVVAGDLALAVANVAGEIIAVDGVCPHAGGPLGDGHLDGCVLTCPWHGWSYDLHTGQSMVVNDVALRRYPVEVIDGVVMLAEEALAEGANG